MVNSNLVKGGLGIGAIGLIAVIALSIVTLVKVNNNNKDKDTASADGGGADHYYNNTIYNITYLPGNDTQIIYVNNFTNPNAALNVPVPQVGYSEKYKQAANYFAASVDTSVSPCDDFYKYSCGKYTNDISFDIADDDNYRKMADAYNVVNANDPLPIQQVKQMYQQCLTDKSNWDDITVNGTRVINIVKDFLAVTHYNFPLVSTATILDATSASTVLGYLSGTYGVDTFISQYVDTNWKDPTGQMPYLLYLDQPALTLPWTYYIGQTWTLTKPQLYKRIVDTFTGYSNFTNTINPADINAAAQNIVDLEYLLANNYSTDALTRWQQARSYNLMRVGDFNKNFSSFDIMTYLTRIAVNADTNTFNRIKDPNYMISIAEPLRMQQMNTAFATKFNNAVTDATLGNYVYFRLLDSVSNYYPSDNIIEEDEFLDRFVLRKPIRGRPRLEKNIIVKTRRLAKSASEQTIMDCVDDTLNYFQYANARVFIDKIYPTEADRLLIRSSVGRVVDSILIGMQSMIDQLSWMSADAKKGAYSKIQNLVRNIAYPDWITDNVNLTKYYQDKNLDKFMNATDYPAMLDMLSKFNAKTSLSLLRRTKPADRTDWNGPPGTVNAWYQPELNSISFPAAILRQPYFDPDWPASVNFGAMGVVAGHELSHGFDSSGTQWDGIGQLRGWLDSNSQIYFNNMTQCVIDEYNGFCPLNSSYSPRCINGQQTVGENVADNGGIHSAFRAYRNTINFFGPDPMLPGDIVHLMSHDQLFFLSFAQVWCQTDPAPDREYTQLLVDPHSPSKYRVFGTIQNFPAFRTAFNCPLSSASAPIEHCNVWISDVNITKDTASSNLLNVPDSPSIKADDNLFTKYSQAQQFFKAALNFSADPCNDFYDYACGSYNQPLGFYIYRNKNYQTMVTKLEAMLAPGFNDDIIKSTAITKTLTFYKACKDANTQMANGTLDGVNSGAIVKKVMDEFKAVTKYNFNWCDSGTVNTNNDPKTLATAMAFLSIKYGVDTLVTPLVDVNAERNNDFASNFTLYIDQSTVTYSKSYYQDGAWEHYTHDVLSKNIKNTIKNYAASQNMTCPDSVLQKNVEAIALFEKLLATSYSASDDSRRDFTRWINPYMVSEVNYTFADWATYVSQLSTLTDTQFVDTGKVDDYLLLVAEPTALQGFDAYYQKAKTIDLIVKYFYYRLLVTQTDFMVDHSLNGYAPLYHESGRLGEKTKMRDPFVSAVNPETIQIDCAEATQDYLQYANARVFTEALYKTDAARQKIRTQTLEVITAIKESMQTMLDGLSWINSDDGTQQGARNKIRDLQINIAYPDFILDNKQLDEYHAKLVFDKTDDYFSMLKKLAVFNQYQNYINLTKSHIDRSNFLGPPGTVNAWYQPEMNSITIPEGILQQPYFDPDWPASIKFGALGVIIGHEITHGFDDQGVQWDGEGVLEPWMSDPSKQQFADMAQCVIMEYSNFTAILNDSYSPQNINGEQTQGENIADNGGIHSGWRSYQRWVSLNGPDPQLPDRIFGQLSHDQLFFLSFAQAWCQAPPSDDTTYRQLLIDPHSPSKFRVFGTIQNFPAFRTAFNCPVGSVYAPKDHCSVWVPKKTTN